MLERFRFPNRSKGTECTRHTVDTNNISKTQTQGVDHDTTLPVLGLEPYDFNASALMTTLSNLGYECPTGYGYITDAREANKKQKTQAIDDH